MERKTPPPLPIDGIKKPLSDVNPLIFTAEKKITNAAVKKLLSDPKSAMIIAEILKPLI